MISADDVRRARSALKSENILQRQEVLEALGWARAGADVVWTSARSGLGQCHLGSYPTAASIEIQDDSKPATNAWWTRSYFGDFRWCMHLAPGVLRWCDLQTQRTWECRADELAPEPLEGLTPECFASLGRFEPRGVDLPPLDKHPGKRATEYFVQQMDHWFIEYLERTNDDVSTAKETFTRVLAALLLLRTIEDVGGVDWLPHGALRDAAQRKNENSEPLRKLFKKAATLVNSRVLRGIADVLPNPAYAICNLVTQFYKENLDFSTIEVDPVGLFYQQLLGKDYQVAPRKQRGLFGENREVFTDHSARRRLGAYFTPREYADVLARRLVLPAARDARNIGELPVILDLAAGSGQLLCAALRQVVSLSRWQRPEAVNHMLEHGLFAVDVAPLAPQLAALNVLRTAILLVPDLLRSGLPFPSLDKNFINSDALCKHSLAAVPEVDVLLLNPPFKGWREWQAPSPDPLQEVVELANGRANYAVAFVAAGLTKLRPGGGVGVILPVSPITGTEHRHARETLSKQLCVETVILNDEAMAFDDDALSYASIVMGHKVYATWRPRTQVIEIPLERATDDLGAVIASAGQSAGIQSSLISIPDKQPWNWTGHSLSAPATSSTAGRMPLGELLGSGFSFHQSPSVAPLPWGRELFLFDLISNGRVRHRATNLEFDGNTPTLRNVAIPNSLAKTPPYTDPAAHGLKVFLPGDGSPEGVLVNSLRGVDPAGYAIARAIRLHVIKTDIEGGRVSISKRTPVFQDLLREGSVQFSWSKGFRSETGPLLVFSQATRMPNGPGHTGGLLWSTWLNLDGSVVPIEGAYARFSSPVIAVALAVLLNTSEAIEGLVHGAPKRNMVTRKPELKLLRDWRVPRLTDSRYAPVLVRLMAAFKAYRTRVRKLNEAAALATDEYRMLCSLGEEIWRM